MNGLKNVRTRRHDALSRVDWRKLEALLADYYRRQGYHVDHTGTGGTGARFDGGVDLKLRKDDAFVLVQSKHWNAKQVPHNDVHELIGLMVNHSATGAILVTSGEFTRAAIDAANRQGHVQLIDGAQLRAMLGPLPEEEVDAEFSPSARFAATVSERRSSGRRPYDEHRELKCLVARIVSVIIGAAVMWLVVDAALLRMKRDLTATHTAARPVQPMQMQSPPPVRQAIVSTPSAVATPPAASDEQDAARARALSDAELKEWQRKNAESMKILEKTTPEIR
jgi:hypothetical protein